MSHFSLIGVLGRRTDSRWSFKTRLGKGNRHILLGRTRKIEPVPGGFETTSRCVCLRRCRALALLIGGALSIVLALLIRARQMQVPIPVTVPGPVAGATGPGGMGAVPGVPGATPLMSRRVPTASYFATFSVLADGDYKNALEAYQVDLRNGIKTLQSLWLDSICYYTMVGESYYRLGNYKEALASFNNALNLYVQYSDWMLRVQFPPVVASKGQSRGTPWGKSTRGAQLGNFEFPTSMLVGSQPGVIQSGQPYQQQQYISIDAKEIVRCTCWSMMRRRQLLGPLAAYDPFSDALVSVTSRRQGPPNHWTEAWLDLQQGFAYAAAGKTGQAMAMLNRSLLVQGQLDHPMSSLARLELGHLALETGDMKAAAAHFEEATYSAVDYPDAAVLEEAFGGWFLTQLMDGTLDKFENVLSTAATFASRGHTRELQASLGLSLAESMLLRGQIKGASSTLDELKSVLARHTMALCGMGSRFNYLNAMLQYCAGRYRPGIRRWLRRWRGKKTARNGCFRFR